MKVASVTVGAAAVQISPKLPPLGDPITQGMKLLGRAANTGQLYYGLDSTVTTATGILIPNGDPGTTFPKVIPASHFSISGSQLWVIASGSGQVLDWEAS